VLRQLWHQCDYIELDVCADNISALKLYTQYGFFVEREDNDYYRIEGKVTKVREKRGWHAYNTDKPKAYKSFHMKYDNMSEKKRMRKAHLSCPNTIEANLLAHSSVDTNEVTKSSLLTSPGQTSFNYSMMKAMQDQPLHVKPT
jgi:hypothetical protein